MKQDFYKEKNVLVTGAGGMAGHAFVKKLLENGANVRATVFRDRMLEVSHKKLEVIRCDLMDIGACKNVVKDMDIVINSVTYNRGAKLQTENPMVLIRSNLYPTLNMMDAACNEEVDIFGYIGSSTVYPDVGYPVKESEGFDGNPSKVYEGIGQVKRFFEKMCEHFHNVTKTKFAIIRTTALYGPHDNFNTEKCHVIPDLIMKACKKVDPFEVWGDGSQIRDFTYVDDLVDGLLLTIENYPVADAINIAAGRATNIKSLVELVIGKCNYNPKLVFNTSKPTMISTRLVSIEKAKKVLGWEPKVSLEEGIEKTINWYTNRI